MLGKDGLVGVDLFCLYLPRVVTAKGVLQGLSFETIRSGITWGGLNTSPQSLGRGGRSKSQSIVVFFIRLVVVENVFTLLWRRRRLEKQCRCWLSNHLLSKDCEMMNYLGTCLRVLACISVN